VRADVAAGAAPGARSTPARRWHGPLVAPLSPRRRPATGVAVDGVVPSTGP
jgi:hypothetical protein